MILYSHDNISIENYGLCEHDINYVKRFNIKWPVKWMQKRVISIVNKHNSLNKNQQTNGTELNKKYDLERLKNRINLYATLLKIFENSWAIPPSEESIAIYKDLFKTDFEYESGIKKILAKIDRYKIMIKEFQAENEQPNKGKFNFMLYISQLELALDRTIRNDKLKKLPIYEQELVDKNEIKNINNG